MTKIIMLFVALLFPLSGCMNQHHTVKYFYPKFAKKRYMADSIQAAPFIMAWEGGLSRATTDTASNNPAPFTYDGKTGWHTNKGITWTTFSSNATKLGYSPTADNFFKMPMEIWNKIFKKVYWDAIQADKIESQALATYAVSWVWGSGVTGGSSRLKAFLKKQGVKDSPIYEGINQLENKVGAYKALELMLIDREQQFISMNQAANLQGWLNRLNWYREKLSSVASIDEKKKNNIFYNLWYSPNKWYYIGAFFLVLAAMFFVIFKKK